MRSLAGYAIAAVALAPSLSGQIDPNHPAGLLQHLSIARFSGVGTESVQAMTTDREGNLYIAGTTSSPDFPVRNAAQPIIGDALLMRSTDVGETWQKVNPPPDIPLRAIPHPTDAGTLFVAAKRGLYRAASSGTHWVKLLAWNMDYFSRGTCCLDIAVDPGDPRRMFVLAGPAAYRASMFVTADGGDSWESRPLPAFDSDVDRETASSMLWVDPSGSGMVGFGLFRSADGGRTWKEMQKLPVDGWRNFLEPDPLVRGRLFAANAFGATGNLFVGRDWGAAWSALKVTPIVSILFDPDILDRLYAFDITTRLRISDNGGSEWRSAPPIGMYADPSLARPIAVPRRCGGGALALAEPQGLLRSRDFGLTWSATPMPGIAHLAVGSDCSLYAVRAANSDAFVAKIAPDGTELWSTFLGGTGMDQAVAVALDSSSNIYVAGNTLSTDFPITVPRLRPEQYQDVFVARLSPEGALLQSTVMGGDGTDQVTSMSVDTASGRVLLSGFTTSSTTFPVTPGTLATTPSDEDGFFATLSPELMLNQATYLPGFYPKSERYISTLTVPVLALPDGKALLGADHQRLYLMDESASSLEPVAQLPGPPMLLASDDAGNIYVAGQTKTGESCLASGSVPLLGRGDVYVTKLQPGRFEVGYTARMAGSCNSWPTSLAVHASGEVTFAVSGNGFPSHNPLLINNSTFSVARLSEDGSALVFSTEVPSTLRPLVAAVSLEDDSIFVSSTSTDFALLKVPVNRSPVIVSKLVNAFSWTPDRVYAGMLATIAGENLSAVEIDLGLNAAQPFPTTLGDVQVLCNGVPAGLMQVAPDRIVLQVPRLLTGDSVTIQVVRSGRANAPIVTDLVTYSSFPLLTRAFPLAPPYGSVDGNIRNANGSLNSRENPAAPGETVRLFATGIPRPGSVDLYWNAPVPARNRIVTPLSGSAEQLPGFFEGLCQIHFTIPKQAGPGVYLVPTPGVLTRAEFGTAGHGVGVWIR
ncbi:MAG: SBBP repeat-containing protein [Bryobacterales bacterium]|nr:SBBP repeat-containing protein [Bryobacterales bacterium]